MENEYTIEDWQLEFAELINKAQDKCLNPVDVLYQIKAAGLRIEYALMEFHFYEKYETKETEE